MTSRNRLRNRLMLVFAGFTMGVAALFGLYAAVFVYAVEDKFFNAMLQHEADRQLRHHAATGTWAIPQNHFMQVLGHREALPVEIRDVVAAEPRRTEFSGSEGRHFHVRMLRPPAPARPAWLVAEVSQQLVVRPMREELFGLLAWSGVLMLVLALLTSWWLARRTANPLARLAALVGGMDPARLPQGFAAGYPDDEVGAVARGLEQLMNRIRAFIAREQEFTRDASHELRTPLAVILSAAERLATEPGLSVIGQRHLDHVRQSVRQLDQTVGILLALAREERIATAQTTPLLPAVEHAIVDQSPWLEGKPVNVVVDVPPQACVPLPAPVLHILLANLVGNAFAHTDAGSVRVDIHDGRLRITNSGHAVDPESWEDALEPFRKRSGSAGLGLGLAIVKRLCDRYGIDLQLQRRDGMTIASFAIDGVNEGR